MKDLKQVSALNNCTNINEICRPFFKAMGINYLGYGRAYEDGSFFDLSTNGNWVEHFIKENYAGIGFTGNSFRSGYYTHSSGLSKLMPLCQFDVAREAFGMYFPLVIVKKFEHFYEYFLLTTHRENQGIYDFYLNNHDLLEQFKLFFKDKISHIIDTASTNRLQIPDIYKSTFSIDECNTNTTSFDNSAMQRQALTNLLISKHYTLTYQNQVFRLSKKQFDCAKLYVIGLTTKEIGRQFNLSYRTVEHYIEAVKQKLNCYRRSEMRHIFVSNFCLGIASV